MGKMAGNYMMPRKSPFENLNMLKEEGAFR